MAVDEEAEIRYMEATLKRWRESANLDLDAEVEEARGHFRHLREETIVEWTAELEHETNPYYREFLQAKIEKIRKIGASDAAAA